MGAGIQDPGWCCALKARVDTRREQTAPKGRHQCQDLWLYRCRRRRWPSLLPCQMASLIFYSSLPDPLFKAPHQNLNLPLHIRILSPICNSPNPYSNTHPCSASSMNCEAQRFQTLLADSPTPACPTHPAAARIAHERVGERGGIRVGAVWATSWRRALRWGAGCHLCGAGATMGAPSPRTSSRSPPLVNPIGVPRSWRPQPASTSLANAFRPRKFFRRCLRRKPAYWL